MTDEEARKWLDREAAKGIGTNAARVIRQMLAQPRLSANWTEEEIIGLYRCLPGANFPCMTLGQVRSFVSRLHGFLTTPKTKMVWRVRTALLSQDYDDAASAHGALWGRMMDHDPATIERCEVPT